LEDTSLQAVCAMSPIRPWTWIYRVCAI